MLTGCVVGPTKSKKNKLVGLEKNRFIIYILKWPGSGGFGQGGKG